MSIIIEQYENMMIVKNWSEATKRTYRSILKKFLLEFKGNVQRATTEEIVEYIASVKSRAAMAQTYGVLKNLYCHVLKQKRKFGFVPFPRKQFKVHIEIPHSEMMDMINAPNLKHRLILHLLYGTGIRLAEICNLKWSDIERTGGANNPIMLIINGKGHKQRKVPVSDFVYKMMIEFCKKYKLNRKDDYVLGGKEPYSHKSVQEVVKKYTDLSPHKLRHLFSQWHVDNGTELETLRQLLGHSSLATVQIYARTKPEKIINPV